MDELPVAQGDAALGLRRDTRSKSGFHDGFAQRLFEQLTRIGAHAGAMAFLLLPLDADEVSTDDKNTIHVCITIIGLPMFMELSYVR